MSKLGLAHNTRPTPHLTLFQFLKLQTVGATVEFSVGAKPVKNFRMIERHFFRFIIFITAIIIRINMISAAISETAISRPSTSTSVSASPTARTPASTSTSSPSSTRPPSSWWSKTPSRRAPTASTSWTTSLWCTTKLTTLTTGPRADRRSCRGKQWKYRGNTMEIPWSCRGNPRQDHGAKCVCVSYASKLGQPRFQKLVGKLVKNGNGSDPLIIFWTIICLVGIFSNLTPLKVPKSPNILETCLCYHEGELPAHPWPTKLTVNKIKIWEIHQLLETDLLKRFFFTFLFLLHNIPISNKIFSRQILHFICPSYLFQLINLLSS